jgi:hypothetical protein
VQRQKKVRTPILGEGYANEACSTGLSWNNTNQ